MNKKKTVETYMEGFNEGDHSKILSLLTEDVVWIMPGYFNLKGKEQFNKEIENDAFTGKPVINLIRMVEEDTIVVAEGTVNAQLKTGEWLYMVFCDMFHFRDEKISQLTSYVMQLNNNKNE